MVGELPGGINANLPVCKTGVHGPDKVSSSCTDFGAVQPSILCHIREAVGAVGVCPHHHPVPDQCSSVGSVSHRKGQQTPGLLERTLT